MDALSNLLLGFSVALTPVNLFWCLVGVILGTMMRKIRLKVDHEIEQKGWDRAARLTLVLAKKQRPSKLIIHFKGTPGNPLSQAEVEDKARKLTRALLPTRQLERLVETVNTLEKIDDVSRIGQLLRRAG